MQWVDFSSVLDRVFCLREDHGGNAPFASVFFHGVSMKGGCDSPRWGGNAMGFDTTHNSFWSWLNRTRSHDLVSSSTIHVKPITWVQWISSWCRMENLELFLALQLCFAVRTWEPRVHPTEVAFYTCHSFLSSGQRLFRAAIKRK